MTDNDDDDDDDVDNQKWEREKAKTDRDQFVGGGIQYLRKDPAITFEGAGV